MHPVQPKRVTISIPQCTWYDWSVLDYFWYARSHMTVDLFTGLRGDLGMRRIGSGMARLDAHWPSSGRFDPNQADAPGLLCFVAQWVDAGWRDVDVIQDGLGSFPKGRRLKLKLEDY